MFTKALLFLSLAAFSFKNLLAQPPINQRQITLLAKMKRPTDLWPRGDGHVVLGEPGFPLAQKGYYEPGGSFSPSPGSFGVSLWVYDKGGNIVATSDNIPIEKISQEYVFVNNDSLPSVKATTPYYTCRWRFVDHGKWQLDVSNVDASTHSIAVVVRSVGPAGASLNSLYWDSTRLMINHRWNMTVSPMQSSVTIGNEETGDLQKAIPYVQSVENEAGWAFGRLLFTQPAFTVNITDTKPQYKSFLSHGKAAPQFELNVPDKDFEKSLQAQIANLMMGYIGRQTGPGEPVNYPLAWERDGAYSLVAMAKSGNLQTARELSTYFAENDFFGGFGAEGDAPGSAINALTEVAFLLNNESYYNWVWPHIKRKLAIIDEMMNAKDNVYKNYIGPVAPHLANDLKRRQLICRKTEDGLIIGTMDLHFPALYITAISYRGLVQASRLATHFKETALAMQCLQKAARLKEGWTANFGKNSKYDNERNFMISIWPSWMTNKENKLFEQKISDAHKAEWNGTAPKERPLWTYFTVAEAHQWLYMDRPEVTWNTLRYFWNNQCSPGLYTYWEGNGEENTFRQWENYRGWLEPKYVTPHYWTASEMALLQMDMLVYVNEAKGDYEIVVGAGVPPEWLNKSMWVKGFKTKAGTVSWEYKNKTLNVTVSNAPKKYVVRPGINFQNEKVRLNVVYK